MGLIVDLIEELSRAHTVATSAQAAFVALSRHVPLAAFEFVLEESDGSRRHSVTRTPEGAARGVEHELRLSFDDAQAGSARVVLLSGAPAQPPELLDDVARVLSAALRQLHALSRVASLSRRAHAQSRELGSLLDELLPSSVVAVSPSMRRIFGELVPAVARQSSTVLLLGETGAGKEVVARRIHELSTRARRAYLRVNCGAIPPTLLESTLFGHERGAFTGALRAQAGLFERAHEGTLLLDEIGELSPDAQVRLLRVLESGEVQRVGGERTLRVDVRVIAATHRDLEAMTRDGHFRPDLFYRLSVFPLLIPPLRERVADIAPLARHILAALARSFGQPMPRLDRPSLERLRAYSWPGNVRELENVLERSLILSKEGALVVDLPRPPARVSPIRFDDAARKCIADALAASGGRIYGPAGAAAILGLKPTTLVSKMERLGLSTKPEAVGPGPRRGRRSRA